MEFVLLAMIVLIVIVALTATKLTDNSYPFPFDRKKVLFTSAEKNFHQLLETAIGDDYKVLNRVKLADLVTIRNGVSKKASVSALTNANNKYLDFVVCDKKTMSPVGAIDLVDTKGRGYKIQKDWFVSGTLEASSIPHLRIKVKTGYNIAEIRSCVMKKMHITQEVKPKKVAAKTIPASMLRARSTTVDKGKDQTKQLPTPPRRILAQLPH